MSKALGSVFSLLDSLKRNLTTRGMAGTAERTAQNLDAFSQKTAAAQKGDKQAQKAVSEQMLEQVLNMSPAGIVVPAAHQLGKVGVDKFMNRLRKGEAPQRLYEDFGGVYYDSVDKLVKEVQSDAGMKLNKEAFRRIGPTLPMDNPTQWVDLMQDRMKLEDVIDHPELFSMYPELRNVNVTSDIWNPRGGYYSADSNTIGIGATRSAKETSSTLLHEVQHAIQSVEDMTRGGNPGMFWQDKKKFDLAQDALNTRRNAVRDLYQGSGAGAVYDNPMYRAIHEAQRTLNELPGQAHSNYLRLGGEAEARAVQKQFESGDYSKLPLSMLEDLKGPRLRSAALVPAVDDNPGIQALIDWALFAPGKVQK